ncbi:toxin-antitoxin system, toxin component [Streptomyces inusitatus]|uniref:toxin-antitoxin system, toxin component n=1 Tax=Streptomyces inusitatus TaxID=68221 RepID=UPI001E34C6D5|nr:toxin-antitoxin system, toxin component [Streptomyces inusitatus]
MARSLRLRVPAEPFLVFTALAGVLSALRRREVRIVFVHFPPETVSGLWADRGDHDLIVVEERVPPQHQLVIAGHEIWHMHAGHRGGHADGAAAAARALVPAEAVPDGVALREAIEDAAARSGFAGSEERAAELFGLLLGTELRPLLEEDPALAGAPPHGVADRIGASLGRRGALAGRLPCRAR